MDMYKHRRQRLLDLINARFDGERVRFCDSITMSESRLAQLLSSTYREGTAFTEKTARKLERLAGLPAMYFDQGAPLVVTEAPRLKGAAREARLVLVYDDEISLIDLYRRADERGRRDVMRHAEREAGITDAAANDEP